MQESEGNLKCPRSGITCSVPGLEWGKCRKLLCSSPLSPLHFLRSHHQVPPTLRHSMCFSPSLLVPSLRSVPPTPGLPHSCFPTFIVPLTFEIVFENTILPMPLPWPLCHFEVVIESVGFDLLICKNGNAFAEHRVVLS